ncbi:LysR family transcriptional regulator [Citrobacter sp. Cpo221]|uniref:LysR family transcriptional regulator n=1 Tax=Citrobacter sp. Cpo221 TaxID=2985155 RepID=UPI002578F92A|nr:LysR family transcriptional regulator [Citrobacter sp. Cpo221]MDM2754079.1 LysR family transcriptional regulator [Citrobacter sp. Cpo221]
MDKLRQIDLNLLLTLNVLLIEKHVSRSAERLHKSQPAISHALALLRRHFDDPLLVRRNGQMVLTAKAAALLCPLHDALASLNGLMGGTSDFDASQAKGKFRIAMSDYATRFVLPRLVRHVREHAPGLDLSVSQVSRQDMLLRLRDGELDLALGLFPDPPEHIRVQSLFHENYVSVADKTSLPRQRELTLTEWLERPHVLVALQPDSHDEIERALALQGLERRIAVAMTHWGVAPDLILGTDLILTVAQRAVEPFTRYKGLKCFAPPVALEPFAYQQGWHVRHEIDPAHRWLREAVWNCSQPV